jgi:hypothetical protein
MKRFIFILMCLFLVSGCISNSNDIDDDTIYNIGDVLIEIEDLNWDCNKEEIECEFRENNYGSGNGIKDSYGRFYVFIDRKRMIPEIENLGVIVTQAYNSDVAREIFVNSREHLLRKMSDERVYLEYFNTPIEIGNSSALVSYKMSIDSLEHAELVFVKNDYSVVLVYGASSDVMKIKDYAEIIEGKIK